MQLIPTILCGGAGSRLWPVSRETHPKPFIRLADGQSLLQKAFLRGASLPGARQVLTLTSGELLFKTRDEYAEVNAKAMPTSFILEPCARGTAAAVAAAACHVAEAHGKDAILVILPADHLIADEAAFGAAVTQAAELASQGRLVTFGIQPAFPETGYGYIEARGNEVLRFVEKPSLEKAKEYVASGKYLWNAGIFCFAAGAVMEEMERHCPEILEGARKCVRQAEAARKDASAAVELEAACFSQVPENSVDYALMEKSGHVAVVPCSIGWSDIGSWNAIGDLTPADEKGNRVEGNAVLHDSSGCYVRSEDRLVGAVGVEDLVIVDTRDALLVASRSKAQDVKQVYAMLKSKGHDAYKLHQTVHRPWGTYTVLEEGPGFKLKRIEVKPGARLSLQMHNRRSEHWIVVNGVADVVNGDRELTLQANESTYIPIGNKHRLGNSGTIPLVMIEVQCGDYVGEDDIVRFDDQYGRVKSTIS
jgi:mannose-1-phosphate guanylyltransferase/mannose-6-phosphate isomerase